MRVRVKQGCRQCIVDAKSEMFLLLEAVVEHVILQLSLPTHLLLLAWNLEVGTFAEDLSNHWASSIMLTIQVV
jgi:hypothetical protein